MATEILRSACPYDCPDCCGLLATVENGKLIRVAGDPEHPYSKGTLCGKMDRYERTVNSSERLTTPLMRTGRKGEGKFRKIGWDEAIETICGKWKKITEETGAESILPYSYAGTMGLIQRNSGHPFFHRLGASRLERTICSPAKDAGWQSVMGESPAPDPEEALDSDLIILWGINAAATSVHFLDIAARARRKGAEVRVIDTYRTITSKAADRTHIVRPGTDAALALGIMHILARDSKVDHSFIKEHVFGFEQLKAQILPAYTTEITSNITGLAIEEIEELADIYWKAKAPFIRLGSGLSRYSNGAMTIRTIASLPALLGGYGKHGAGCFCGTSTSSAFAMNEITREDFMKTPSRLINMNQLGDALTLLRDPPVMSLYVYHSNPASVSPDQNRVLAGLSREELFTVVHERFMTDTAVYADIVLPATSSLEHSDLYRSYGHYCIQRAKPAIKPVGECLSNLETFSRLAECMGFEEPFFRMTSDDLIDHLLSIPSPLRQGIDTQKLKAGFGVRLSKPAQTGVKFATSSGKIEILNLRLEEPLPRYFEPRSAVKPYQYCLISAPALYGLNSSFFEREDLCAKQGMMRLMMNQEDAASSGLIHGAMVSAWNDKGNVTFILETTDRVPGGVVVAEGVYWMKDAPGRNTVNALTSQDLTDLGRGSTFYDAKVNVTGL